MKKIAFCFLIYDEINNEKVWYHFFEQQDPSLYNIYIHYKEDKPLKYFNNKKLKQIVNTEYGTVSIVKAMNLLLREALKDINNYKFIFVSQACIPLKSFDYVYKYLTSFNESSFNRAPDKACFPRCLLALEKIDKQYVKKASQWCILNRKHVELIIKNEQKMLEPFLDTLYVDEHCYLTFIYLNGLEKEIIETKNSSSGATTFTNWSDMKYRYLRKNKLKSTLYNYDNIDSEEIEYLLIQPCLFGRKFNKNCKVVKDNNYIDLSKYLKKYLVEK